MSLTSEQIEKIRERRSKQKLSVVFEMPDLAESGQVVSNAEIEFFKVNGFLVKKGLLDPSRLDQALERIWSHLLEKVPRQEDSGWKLIRDDKTTWVNPPSGLQCRQSLPRVNIRDAAPSYTLVAV